MSQIVAICVEDYRPTCPICGELRHIRRELIEGTAHTDMTCETCYKIWRITLLDENVLRR